MSAPNICRPVRGSVAQYYDPGVARFALHPWLPYGRAFGATGATRHIPRYLANRKLFEGKTGVLVRLTETKREGTDLPQDQCPCLYLSSPMEN
jgi:hypothetical protein